MKTKSVLYAVVGAPVVAARKVGDTAGVVRVKLSENATGYGQAAEKAIDNWAVEGEKVVGRITDGKVVEEISSKVDLDQAKEQVGKLRDQLEDMLATWRTSFRAEKPAEPAKAPAKKPAAKTTAKTGTTTKASPAKTTRSSAEKTSSSKTASATAEKAS
jgi:pyruvate/2-oxoglutarate dehydrogenase complex dihydrolipoamide acyltransferase (E2) component